MNYHPKKTTVQELKDLKPGQVGAIKRIYESFGTGADGVRRVAEALHMSDSAAKAMATALTESKAPAKAVTESVDVHGAAATLSDTSARGQYLAGKLAKTVNEAEARIESDDGSLANLSIQHLESLAAAWGR
jgi:hypothetical protein